MQVRKYEILKTDVIRHEGALLYRVRHLKTGKLGGYVESEQNLSHEGTAWVHPHAKVMGEAIVYGSAQVFGNACLKGRVRVFGGAQIFGGARLEGEAWVSGNAQVFGGAQNIRPNPN